MGDQILIDRQVAAPGPIRLLSAAATIFRSDFRFFGILALMGTLMGVGSSGAGILLRPQPAWLQFLVTLSITAVSFFLSMAVTVVNLGAVDRHAGGIQATASGALEDVKRAYLPLLGTTILLIMFLFMGVIAFGIAFSVVFAIIAFFATIVETWWLFVPVFLAMIAVFIAQIYVTFRLALTSAAVVLGRLGPWEAIKASWSRSRGHFWKILGVNLPMLPFMILTSAAPAMSSMSARSAMETQDLGSAFTYKPPPIVDALALISTPFVAIMSLWIGAAFALLWLHLDGSESAPETSTPVRDA